MKIIEKNRIDEAYEELVQSLLNAPIVNGTHEINNCCVVVNNPTLDLLRFPHRKISQTYSDAEMRWYWSGDNSCENIGKYTKMWLALTDDGKTNNSAYGYILFKKYGFNQVEQIIELLKKDKYSRRALLNISDPSINRIETKDMQCTIGIQFLIRDNKLEETVMMRSNDVYFRFPYDYIFSVSIGNYIAKELGIKFSKYTHHATSLHMYLRDEEKFTSEDESTYFMINWKDYIEECYEI